MHCCIIFVVTIVHDNRYSLNENSKTREKKYTNENRNDLCKICECQNFNYVFLSVLRQCFRNMFVTLFFSLCKFRLETTISFIFLSTIDDSKNIDDWIMNSRTNHCENWNDQSKCDKRDLKTKIEKTTKTQIEIMQMKILIAKMKILIAKMKILTATRCKKRLIFCIMKWSISLTKQNDKAISISRTYVVENSSNSSFSNFD